MKKYLQSIFWLGTSEVDTYEESKRIEFSNQICFFYSVMAFFYVIIFLFIKSYVIMSIVTLNLLGYICCLLLNKWRYFKSSSVMIIINATVSIYFSTALTGKAVGGQFFLVFLIPLVGMLFNKSQKNLKIGCLLLPLSAFILLEITDYYFFYKLDLSKQTIKYLSVSVFIVTCLILYAMIQFYINIFQHIRNSLNQMVALYPLTEREIDIISIVVKGKSNKDIGRILFIEENTVKNHLKNIFVKLSVKTRSELMAKCMSIKLN